MNLQSREHDMKHLDPAHMRTGLRVHAIAFVVGIAAMLIINVLTGAPYWVAWVVPGWAIGLLSHWLSVRRPLARYDQQERAR